MPEQVSAKSDFAAWPESVRDRQRFETARSGDAVAGLLLVGADEQKFLHGGTGLQLAT